MGRLRIFLAKNMPKISTVSEAGIPIIQKELIPLEYASSGKTRKELAPSQLAASERKTSEGGRFREARKKSSRLLILFKNKTPVKKIIPI